MLYTRKEHNFFLKEEFNAQTEEFIQKLETSASFLLIEKEELFVAQFIKFKNGEMILKFSNNRRLPRQREYLYCFTVPQALRDYKNWDDRTYGDLVHSKDNFTECVFIWKAPSEDKDFVIAGFRGVELEFFNHIKNTEGIILVLGPQKPPIEYIENLQKIVNNKGIESANEILDQDFMKRKWVPNLLDVNTNTLPFIKKQLQKNDSVIIQGPPGTGKTFFIAELIANLANQNKSILVTALTNRALIEIIEKPAMKGLLEKHRVFKTVLSVDEERLHKDLMTIKDVVPLPGSIILSTFYITSGQASQITNEPPFDFVIVDEASQALLSMFACAAILGKKNIWIGDTEQLPPVVVLSEDKVNKKNYGFLVDGLKTLSDNSSFPIFQLPESYRLTERAVKYTSIFYKGKLKSKSKKDICLSYEELDKNFRKYFNDQGGPTLIKTNLPIGNYKPTQGIALALELVNQLLLIKEKIHISVLSFFIESTRALQQEIYQIIGYKSNLEIETVSRVQGLTTDICIYFVPNSGYHRSLEKRLFNVATSRAKRQTIIIADKDIMNWFPIDTEVKKYLERLNKNFSFFVEPKKLQKLLL